MRLIEKKRPPLMNARRWTILIVLILIALTILITLFYRDIQSDRWNEKTLVRESLSEFYDLSSEQYLEKYTWDNQYWIMLATNNEQVEQYVSWSDNEIIGVINANSIISVNDALERIQRLDTNAIEPTGKAGYMSGQFVWEVKYKDNKSEHVKYAFFSMLDGKLIDIYTIPKGT